MIFHHNINNSDSDLFFKDNNEALRCNKRNKFSILYKLDDSYKNEQNSFEFLLTYPQSPGYVHWTQKENPIHRHDNLNYHIINNTYSNTFPFEGLCVSNTTYTFLEGQYSIDRWYFSIGQKRESSKIPKCLAGPNVWTIDEKNIVEVNLYIRIYDSSLIRKLYSYNSPVFQQKCLSYSLKFAIFVSLIYH